MNFLPMAAALAVGIYSADLVPVFPAIAACAVFILLCIIRRLRGSSHASDAAFAAFMLVLGICLSYHASSPNIDTSLIDRYVTVKGCITAIPYNEYENNHYVLHVNEIDCDGKVTESDMKLLLSSDKLFECGDSVEAHGKLRLIESDSGKYSFNASRYYSARGIYAKLYSDDISYSETQYTYRSPAYAVNIIRSKIAALICRKYSGDIAAAMTAVITGDKHQFSSGYNKILIRTGTGHMYYPAFAHIMLISMLVGLLRFKISKKIRDYIMISLLMLYALYNCSNATAMKNAVVLLLFTLSARLFGISSFINMLSLYVIAVGISNPMLLFDEGFIMSVSSSVIIQRFSEIFKSKNRIKRFFIKYAVFVIGLIPINAYLFGSFSLYAYPASIVFVTVIMMIIILSPLFLMSCVLPLPFGWIVHKLTLVLLHIPIIIDDLPFSSVNLPKPSVVMLLAFYIFAAALWYVRKRSFFNARLCTAVSAGLIASQLVAFAGTLGKIELDFIDVGQGDATLIHMPLSGNILIDGGGAPVYSSYNIGENVFVPYITGRGANTIQAAFVSHYHKDHAEGIIAALRSTRIINLFLPDIYPDDDIRLELESAAKERGTKIIYVSEPMHIVMDDITADVYPPDSSVTASGDMNDTSLMINLRYGEFNCLFTGDMSTNEERYMLKNKVVPNADVLKISHHGSVTASSEEMINTVNPRFALIGVGSDNEYGFPKQQVLDRLTDIDVLRTDLNGTISITADKNANISVKSERN